MKKVFFIFILIFGAIFSNESINRRILATPVVTIHSDGEKEIIVDSIKISTEIKGNISTTTYEITFYNPNNRILEGEFEFPLLEGQNVTGYALDINGKMRDGVVVEKEKARQTFEAIERQNVDPGILEKTKGNNYKTRIYPMPSKGYRTVKISYEEILKKENNTLVYNLPLNYKNTVKDFSLEIKVPELKIKPEFVSKISGLDFSNLNTGYYAKIEKKNYKPNQNIKFNITSENTEKTYTETKGNTTYFLSTVPVNGKSKERAKSENITLVWDISNSGNNRNTAEEIKFLDSYFGYLKNAKVTLIMFNNKVSMPEVYDVKSGSWEKLKDRITNLYYDGETKFQNLNFEKYKSDEIILVTDGLLSYGKERIKLSKIPVIIINSSKEADGNYLKSVAAKTKGKYIDLSVNSIEKELKNMKNENYRMISYSYKKNEIGEIYPPVAENMLEDFSFTGKMKVKKAEITVNFGYGNIITESRKVLINTIEQSSGIDRIWAGKKIEDLNSDYENNREEIIKTAKEYSIVTDDTTLIVLDRIEDYVRYEIVPPLELREEYYKLTEKRKKEKDNEKKRALEESLSVLENIKKWYTKDFPKTKPEVKSKPNVKENITRNEMRYDSEVSTRSAADFIVSGISLGIANDGDVINSGSVTTEATDEDNVNYKMVSEVSAKKEYVKINNSAQIKVKAWSPDEPYLKELEKTAKSKLMEKYHELKKEYSAQPSFYIDVADYLIKNNMISEAEQVLSNVSEMKLESPELLKTYGYKLLELKKNENAVEVFKELVRIKGEDPQSYRDLAMSYERNGDYQEALDTYYIILSRNWDGRFHSVKDVVLKEMNRLVSQHSKLNLSKVDKRLIYPMPLDVRVVLEWTADNSDIDLHLVDPYGEEGYYSNSLTRIGSRLSGDITQGFGPEEFALNKAVSGKYLVKVKYFGDSRQNLAGPITLRVVMYTNYGTKKEKMEEILVRVKGRKEMLEIGELLFK